MAVSSERSYRDGTFRKSPAEWNVVVRAILKRNDFVIYLSEMSCSVNTKVCLLRKRQGLDHSRFYASSGKS